MATVVALSGGIGGAKLALGLDRELRAGALTVVCNTGDDFEHLGLLICPDLDTVTYTLAGLADPGRGWGLAGETWAFMSALERLGGETWFRLGDGDLATHVDRTARIRAGEALSAIADRHRRALGVGSRIVPMTETPVRTMVLTPDGALPFQRYFVEMRCEPAIAGFEFAGAAEARPAPGIAEAIERDDLAAIVICPSNPFISIDPILAVPGIRESVAGRGVPVIAISPVIGGESVKGPTAKMMRELGFEVGNRSVAAHYAGVVTGLVIDAGDAGEAGSIDLPCLAVPTMMRDESDKRRLARDVLAFAIELGG